MLNDKFLKLALDKIPEKYLLINMLSKRVEQLSRGARPLVENESLSNLDIALKEVIEDKITFKLVEQPTHAQ